MYPQLFLAVLTEFKSSNKKTVFGKRTFSCFSKTKTTSKLLGILEKKKSNIVRRFNAGGVKLNTYSPSLSLTPFIRVRADCGAECLSCLGEQTGLCLWWWGDQSWGHILHGRAKVAAEHTLLPCCAVQLGDPEYTQCKDNRRVCLSSTQPATSSHTPFAFQNSHSNLNVHLYLSEKQLNHRNNTEITNLSLCKDNSVVVSIHTCFSLYLVICTV